MPISLTSRVGAAHIELVRNAADAVTGAVLVIVYDLQDAGGATYIQRMYREPISVPATILAAINTHYQAAKVTLP